METETELETEMATELEMATGMATRLEAAEIAIAIRFGIIFKPELRLAPEAGRLSGFKRARHLRWNLSNSFFPRGPLECAPAGK